MSNKIRNLRSLNLKKQRDSLKNIAFTNLYVSVFALKLLCCQMFVFKTRFVYWTNLT